ncbi:hypothetical protein KY343_05630, partial [Candidatus Woesearchaeota archaeon]|nr:hypothetical protein [Candidatus Woesearchaeota archaeon]
EMPIGDGAKARMDDLIDGIETILINEESEPVLLCEENYNGDYTMDPTTYLADADYYLVDNTYNGADDPVYCTSKRTSDEIGLYNFILMIPIPSDTIAGSYSGNIYFEPWQS